jgi:hypothetical protein
MDNATEPEHSSNSSASSWLLLDALQSDSTPSNIAWSYNTNSHSSSARDTPSASDRSASHGLVPTPIETVGSSPCRPAGGVTEEDQQGHTRDADTFAELFIPETHVSHDVCADTSENWQPGQSSFAIANEGASLLGINRRVAEFSDSAGAAKHNNQVMNPASTLSLTPSSRDSQPRRQKGSASTLEPSRSPSFGTQPGPFLGYEHASNDQFAVDDFQWIADNEGPDYFESVDNLFPIHRQVTQNAVAVPTQEHILDAPTEPVKRTKAKRKRLDADQKQKVKRVRRLGACLRCRMYREPVRNTPTSNVKLIRLQCDESTPCLSCTRRAASATLFKQPCYRESLDNVVAFRLGRSCSDIDLHMYTPKSTY